MAKQATLRKIITKMSLLELFFSVFMLLALILTFNVSIQLDFVYPANHAERQLATLEEEFLNGELTEEDIPFYYDYQFTNADKVEFFIVATDRQKEVLSEQFAKYTKHRPAIYTIPVGSLTSLTDTVERKPFSMITASRLATEKHIL